MRLSEAQSSFSDVSSSCICTLQVIDERLTRKQLRTSRAAQHLATTNFVLAGSTQLRNIQQGTDFCGLATRTALQLSQQSPFVSTAASATLPWPSILCKSSMVVESSSVEVPPAWVLHCDIVCCREAACGHVSR